MSEELLSKCCPTYFKATRCDNSCFRRAEAYIATDTFNGLAPNREYVRYGTDDAGDDVCWYVDRNQTELTSVPNGATIITGLTAGTDILDSEDDILIESAAQDDTIWIVVADCRRTDYDVILKGGSGTDYLVDDATKRENFRKRFGSSTTNVSLNCLVPRQQIFAFNTRAATIDGSTTHQGNSGSGDPDPLAVGKFVKISGSFVDASGSAASVYKTTVVGNNAHESGLTTSTLTNGIFKIIDIKRQNKPGTSNLKYYRDIAAYINSPVVTSLNTNCSDCLQAYLDFEGESGATDATLDTIIPFATAGDDAIDLIFDSISLWPCRVNINRTFNMSCSSASSNEVDNDKIRSRKDLILGDADPVTVTQDNCSDPADNTVIPLNSFDFCYDTGDNMPLTQSIFNAHRRDKGASINTVTINTEYTKNLRTPKNNADAQGSCGDTIRVSNITDSSGVSTTFDYLLNSVSITTSYGTDPTEHTDVPMVAVFPTTETTTALEVPVLPGWVDGQQTACDFNLCEDNLSTNTYQFDNAVKLSNKHETTTPSIGLDATNKVYHGRVGMIRTDGRVTPMLRYSNYYCNVGAARNVNPVPAVPAIQDSINEDRARLGGGIDLIVPLAPQLEIAAGFNVNGFIPTHQRTDPDGGRSSIQDPADSNKRCYPGKSHQAKFTFGTKSVDGESITSLPFFLQSYCCGTTGYTYVEGTHSCLTGNPNIEDIRDIEKEFDCDPQNLDSQHTSCRNANSVDCPDGGDYSTCRDIHILTNPSFLAFFACNNQYSKFNGTAPTGSLDSGFLYAGNGKNYTNGFLSGDKYEYVDTGSFGIGNASEDLRIGVDSEWSSVYIEAQDPWTRGCTGCLSSEFGNDNYELLNDPIDNFDADEFNNPHTS